MKKTAQNVIEIGILAAIVLLVSIATFTIFNNQKVQLVKLSEVTVSEESNSPSTDMATIETSGKVSVKKDYIYTASTSSKNESGSGATNSKTLPDMLGLSKSDFEKAVKTLTYNDLKKAASLISTTKTIIPSNDQAKIGANEYTLDEILSIAESIARKDADTWTSKEQAFFSKFKSFITTSAAKSGISTKTQTSTKDKLLLEVE